MLASLRPRARRGNQTQTRRTMNELFDKLEPFADQRGIAGHRQPCHVAPGPSEALNETLPHRVEARCHDDRDGGGRALRRGGGRRPDGYDDARAKVHDLCSEARQALRITLGKS